jgi:hypothetical protein
MDGSIATIDGDGFSVEELRWRLNQTTVGTVLELEIGRLESPDAVLQDLRLTCPRITLSTELWHCSNALATGTALGEFGEVTYQGQVSLQYEPRTLRWRVDGRWDLDLAGLQGSVVGVVTGATDGMVAELEAISVPLAALQAWSPVSIHAGQLDGAIRLEIRDGRLDAHARLSATDIGFDSEDGSIAGDSVNAGLELTLSGDSISLAATPSAGEVLLGNLYLALGEIPELSVSAKLDVSNPDMLNIQSFKIADADALQLEGRTVLDTDTIWPPVEMTLETVSARFPEVEDRYLAAIVETLTGGSSYRTAGQIRGSAIFGPQGLTSLEATVEHLSVDDDAGRFAVQDLNAEVLLDSQQAAISSINWTSGKIYSVGLGAADLNVLWDGGRISLTDPVRVDILDGALGIDTLAFELGNEGLQSFDFAGVLEPISLNQVTEAMAWPEMNGTLSGSIPRVALREGVIEVGGTIGLDVFDGRVEIDQMRLERVFGVLPTLAANVRLQDLDLETMTGTFSFGKIEGRLDGRISGLRLLDWTPVAFDLELISRDRGKRRISQRAVDNLSAIGGGPSALVSQTFLRFFDDFGYRQLGLKCQLRNNVCRMGGVGAAGNGYYIVQGSGLPRIDVIGFSAQVDWPQLLRRLKAATRSAASFD